MKIPRPFIPLRATCDGLSHTVSILGRDYTFGADGLLSSIRSEGVELLASPVRIVSSEEGCPSLWDSDYTENESESFIMERSDESLTLCGTMQSERFILNSVSTVCYDGAIEIGLKLMTRGLTVAQVFGTAATKPLSFGLDFLHLEIPLKTEACTLFHMFPNSEAKLADGTVRAESSTSMSGFLPKESISLPFKPLLWLGDDERGFGWFSESDKNWQPADPSAAIEIIRDGEVTLLRIRLLDSQPLSWSADPLAGSRAYLPISFSFGFQITPVKPMPANPYIHNALHLDCGKKIKGNYMDFLSAENRFDRLVEKGVTTLILHEKWNKCQNTYELSEFTKKQLTYICDECHKRGIRVLTYFGYEISTLSPQWDSLSPSVSYRKSDGKLDGGWWRVPFQRDYIACYNTEYEDMFIEGVARIMDEFHTDGVYLDGTHHCRCCYSTEHGCGWYDTSGVLHGSYNINGVRHMFRRLYSVVSSRGGEINVHAFGFINFTALAYIDQTWYGENLQFELMKGSTADMRLDYFRAEYGGRNMGVPVEFIAYENRPYWTFENAVACSLLNGILPRPNDIGYPLDLMSGIWKIIGSFPIDKSVWQPYYKGTITTSCDKVKVSCYRYTDLVGDVSLLAFAVNISSSPVESVSVDFGSGFSRVVDAEKNEETGFSFSMEKYGYRILFVK